MWGAVQGVSPGMGLGGRAVDTDLTRLPEYLLIHSHGHTWGSGEGDKFTAGSFRIAKR